MGTPRAAQPCGCEDTMYPDFRSLCSIGDRPTMIVGVQYYQYLGLELYFHVIREYELL